MVPTLCSSVFGTGAVSDIHGYPWSSMHGHCYLCISQDTRGFARNQDSIDSSDPICVTLASDWCLIEVTLNHVGVSLESMKIITWISMRSVDIHGTMDSNESLEPVWVTLGSLWSQLLL